MAARISTASRPSRKTMIAALVTTVVRLALSPSVAARVLELVVEREPRGAHLAPRGALGDQLGQAVVALGAEPDQALDVGREPGVDRLQPPLRAELEERVRLEPRLLGLAALAGARRRPPCGRASARSGRSRSRRSASPRLRHDGLEPLLDLLALRLDVSWLVDARLALRRPRRRRRRARRAATPRRRWRAASRLASWSRRSSKAASVAVWNAIASWISKSSVTRPSLTPRPYSTGTSATKRSSCWARRADSSAVNGAAVKPSSAVSISARAAATPRRSPLRGARRRSANVARGGGGRGVAAVLAVARREDLPVARRLRGGLGRARAEALLAASASTSLSSSRRRAW